MPSTSTKPSTSSKLSTSVKPSTSAKPSTSVRPSASPKPLVSAKASKSPKLSSAKPSTSALPSTSAKSSSSAKPTSAKPSSSIEPSTSAKSAKPAPNDGYDEWQRQKTLNAQYFTINTCTTPSSKKSKLNLQNVTPTQECSTSQCGTTSGGTGTPPSVATAEVATSTLNLANSTVNDVRAILPTVHNDIDVTLRIMAPPSTALPNTATPSTATPSTAPPKTPAYRRIAPKDDNNPSNKLITEENIPNKFKTQSENTQNYPKITLVPFENLADKKTKYNPSSFAILPVEHTIYNENVPESSQRISLVRLPTAEVQDNQTPVTDEKVSILEQYSRTLTPKVKSESDQFQAGVKAMSLQVPGPQGPQTTIIMAVTVPTEQLVTTTDASDAPVETVDLTSDSDSREPTNITTEVKHKTRQVISVTKVTAGPTSRARSLLKRVTPMIRVDDAVIEIGDDTSGDSAPDASAGDGEGGTTGAESVNSVLYETSDQEAHQPYIHKKDAPTVAPSQLASSSTLLCVDARRPPLRLSAGPPAPAPRPAPGPPAPAPHPSDGPPTPAPRPSDEPPAPAPRPSDDPPAPATHPSDEPPAPCAAGYLVLTDRRTRTRSPTYWTIGAYSSIVRVVLPQTEPELTMARQHYPELTEAVVDVTEHVDSSPKATPNDIVLEKSEAGNSWRITSRGDGARGEGGPRKVHVHARLGRGAAHDAGAGAHNCNFKILTALTSMDECHSMAKSGAALFMLSVQSGRWFPLNIVREGGARGGEGACGDPHIGTLVQDLQRLLGRAAPDQPPAAAE